MKDVSNYTIIHINIIFFLKSLVQDIAWQAAEVFNLIVVAQTWPDDWKKEYVTVIPKGQDPQDPSECTNFLSKLFESYVMEWSRQEVKPKRNQYGGEPGAVAAIMLVEVVDSYVSTLEDNRAAAVLSAIDFSKAFNRLHHEKCLESFKEKGSSTPILALLASFLTGRTMSVKTGNCMSSPRKVNPGAPKGSVLGCSLFNIAIDSLEEGFEHNEEEPQDNFYKETLTRSEDFPAALTPSRVRFSQENVGISPIPRDKNSPGEFRFLSRVANIPPWVKKPKDPKYVDNEVMNLKFVDDGINVDKIHLRKAELLVEEGCIIKELIAKRTQELLRHISKKATKIGMLINAKKMALMCISAAVTFEPRVRVEIEGTTIKGSDTLKLLGLTIDSNGSFKTHINNLKMKLRKKTWALLKLKKAGLGEKDLVHCYKSLTRPVVEYVVPAWHSLTTADQAEQLERQQS